MSETSFTAVSTVGVVADIRRDGEGDYVATKCSVFGINEEEYNVLGSGCEIRPKYFTLEAERFMVHCSPWKAMRILGDNFGYYLPVPPLTGRVECPSGDRKTCIYTLHRKKIESVK